MLPERSIWIDVQGCQNTDNFERGIARQAAEHTKALLGVAPEAIHSVGLSPHLPVPSSLNFLHGSGLLAWATGKGAEPDPAPPIYHVTSPFEGPSPIATLEEQWPHWARRAGGRLVITLHDLIPLIFAEHYIDPNPLHFTPYLSRLGMVREADHILAVSQSSANDAVERLEVDENRITVIDAGTSMQIAGMVGSREEAAKVLEGKFPGLRDGFLFYVGGGDWRKNVTGLIEAYGRLPERLRDRHQLVITYKLDPEARHNLETFARRHGIHGNQLLLTGFVPDRELSALYRRCGLFVFPSLYEGAGLPILEAMACGAPVIGSNVSSVPEIIGDSRATFDPSDPGDVARAIERVLVDDDELDRLRAVSAERIGHFTWDRVAEKSLEGYERALMTPGRRDAGSGRRKRVAIFAPWPPDPSAAASYSVHLAERLAERVDVDVIVPALGDDEEYDHGLEPRVKLWRAGDFDWVHALRAFDRILYMLGNSPSYLHSLRGLLRRPGVVVAHDIRYGNLYRALHEADLEDRDNPLWLREKLYELYGGRVPASELRLAAVDEEAQVRFGVYMSREVQAHAEKIVVHSRYAADALRMDRLPGEPGTEALIVHRGIPERPVGRHGDSLDPPIVLSHGTGEHAESIDLLVHAFAESGARRRNGRLVLIGDLEAEAERRLWESASNLGIADLLSTQGRLEGDTYWETLAHASVAIELRSRTDGEASGSVCDCLAARVPTIVSAIGWMLEIPSPAVLHVPADCAPAELTATIDRVVGDGNLRERIRAAQDEYAAANSYDRVAERYLELLGL